MYKVRDHNRLQSNEQLMARRRRGEGHRRVIDYSSHEQGHSSRMHPAKFECPACVAGGRRPGRFAFVALLLGIELRPKPDRCRVVDQHQHMLRQSCRWWNLLASR